MNTTPCEELLTRYPVFLPLKADILAAYETLKHAFEKGGKLLLCGNGGSAADCEHIVGELMKSFLKKRPIDEKFSSALAAFGEDGQKLIGCLERGLPAIALTSHTAFSTAFANDKEPSAVFAQQLSVLGRENDVLLCISTSGNSKNCVLAAIAAKAKGIKIISMTGAKESRLSELSDVAIRVPETETFKVQELHLPLYHALCAMLEEEFF